MSVQEILRIDSKHRYETVDTDLYKLSDLEQKYWDYSLPTLVSNDNVFLKSKIKSTCLESFREKFYQMYPATKFFNWSNVLVAGGSVGKLIFGSETNDVDIFIYGLNPEQASSKVDELCANIVKYNIDLENSKTQNARNVITNKFETFTEEELELQYSRTKRTLTITIDNEKYQIIFRAYKTKSEILHGFDLGSSAIGFDGQNVLLTSLGRFAYEYGCNIVDTTRRSTTYEHRLRKYLQRGFEIVMPNLDINLLTTRLWDEYQLPEVCELPYLLFTFQGRNGNKIKLNAFYYKQSEPISDYDDQSEMNEYSTFFLNIKRLLRGEYDNIVYLGNTYSKVLHKPRCFTSAGIDYFYDNLKSKIFGRQFPATAVENYMTLFDPGIVFANRKNSEKIAEMIETMKDHVKKLSENLSEHTEIQWLTVNPGTQLTSSFNPIFKDPKEWYGRYWKADIVENPMESKN